MNRIEIQKTILSATLKAEAVRIRHLRARAKKTLARARSLRQSEAGTDTEAQRLTWLSLGLKEAAICPAYRARCANLALGYLKGRAYLQIEAKTRTSPYELYSCISREVAKKAGVPHEDIVTWLRVPAVSASKKDAA